MSLTNHPHESQGDPCPAWLLDAIEDVVYRSTHRAPAIASRMGCSESLLYSFATRSENPSGKHWHLPAYRILPLTVASGNYAIIDELERQSGRHIPSQVGQEPEQSLEQLSVHAIAPIGTFLERMSRALEDHELDDGEVKDLESHIEHIHQALSQWKAKARAERNGGG